MLPLAIDKFDLFILKQLFPNFKLSIEQIMTGIEKHLLKELEALSRFDLRKYFSCQWLNYKHQAPDVFHQSALYPARLPG